MLRSISEGGNDVSDIYGDCVRNLKTDESVKKYVLENIDKAIQKGHIAVYFQPVIRTLTGELYGTEAVSRWVDPVMGLIPPDSFIPVLEEHRLIHKLDIHLINTVVSTIRKGRYRSEAITPVSFNLSECDFMLFDPIEVIETAMGSDTWILSFLRIEISESALMHDGNEIGRAHV